MEQKPGKQIREIWPAKVVLKLKMDSSASICCIAKCLSSNKGQHWNHITSNRLCTEQDNVVEKAKIFN